MPNSAIVMATGMPSTTASGAAHRAEEEHEHQGHDRDALEQVDEHRRIVRPTKSARS
jgi:hypothetical protein